MMKDDKIDDGGSAFPAIALPNDGMTYRQWLAGLAMQAFVSTDSQDVLSIDKISELALAQADALIKAEKERL